MLDLVRHGLKTVIGVMRPADRLTLITFNNAPTKLIEWSDMSEGNAKEATTKVDGLRSGGGTNIFKAL